MIFIVVKFKVKPDWSDRWLGLVQDFTRATRQEPGNLWFDWSRSVEDPNEFVLVEAFKDDAAGDHVFGVPFFIFRGEPFWGHDRLPLLESRLSGAGLLR